MMNRRILLLLAFDGLLLGAIGLSALGEDPRVEIRFRLPALAELGAIGITRTGQPAVELRRAGERWVVGEAGDPMDPYALEALTEAMSAPLGADLAVPAAGAALDDYGLGPHAVTARLGEGDGALTVRIGRVVDGRRSFVWPVDGPQIYRVRADLGRVFERPALDWSDRRLVPLAFDQIAGLQATRDALDWAVSRASADGPWTVQHPPGLRADPAAVDAVVNTLVTARSEGFAPLDGFRPTLTLQGATFDGGAFSIAFDRGPDGELRARVPGRRRLSIVPRHQAVFLDARRGDLRDRRVFGPGVTAAALDGVVIDGPHPLRIERDPERRWRMSAPRDAGPLPEAAVEPWLAALVGAQAVGFDDRPPPDAFERPWRVSLRLGDRQVTLEVGAAFGHQARLARRVDEPERVMVLGASALLTLQPAIEPLVGEGAERAAQPPGR